jgi:hypothetical protein
LSIFGYGNIVRGDPGEEKEGQSARGSPPQLDVGRLPKGLRNFVLAKLKSFATKTDR